MTPATSVLPTLAVLLALLSTTTTAIAPPCIALTGFAGPLPLTIDGLHSNALSSLAWVHQACASSTDVSSFRYDSQNVPFPTHSFSADGILTPAGVLVHSVDAFTIRRTATVTLGANATVSSSTLSVSFNASLTVQVDSSPPLHLPICGQLSKSAPGAYPATMADALASLPWQGTLNSDCGDTSSNIRVSDLASLFDGAPAYVLIGPRAASTSPSTLALLDIVAINTTNLALLANSPALTPSGLAATTFRGIARTPAPCTNANTLTVGLRRATNQIVPNVAIVQSRNTCSNNCPSDILTALTQIVEGGECLQPRLNFLRSTLSLATALHPDVVLPRVHTTSAYALFACANDTHRFVNVAFDSLVVGNDTLWPTALFFNDSHLATTTPMIQSVRPVGRGRLTGYTGATHTLVNRDLFASGYGGVLIQDTVVASASASFTKPLSNLFQALYTTLTTSQPDLNSALATLLSPASAASLTTAYDLTTTRPSFVNLLTFIDTQQSSFKLSLVPHLDQLVVDVSLSAFTPSRATAAPVSLANSALAQLAAAVHSAFPSTARNLTMPTLTTASQPVSAQFNGSLTAVLVVSNISLVPLFDARWHVTPSMPTSFAGATLYAYALDATPSTMASAANFTVHFNSSHPALLAPTSLVAFATPALVNAGIAPGPFSLGPSNALLQNVDVALLMLANSLSLLRGDLVRFCNQFATYESTNLDLCALDESHRLHFNDIAIALANTVKALPAAAPLSAFALRSHFLDTIRRTTAHLKAASHAVVSVDNTGVSVTIALQRLTTFIATSTSTTWRYVAALDRLLSNLLLSASITFRVNYDGSRSLQPPSIGGVAHSRDFAVAFHAGMLSGVVVRSNLTLAIEVPITSRLEVELDVTTHDGATDTAVLSTELFNTQQQADPSNRFELTSSSTARVDPVKVAQDFSNVLQSISEFLHDKLNLGLQITQESIGAITNIEATVARLTRLLTFPFEAQTAVVRSPVACASLAPSLRSIAGTVNGVKFNCSLALSSSLNNLEMVAAHLQTALADPACSRVGTYLRVVALLNDPVTPDCGRIELRPATPGIVTAATIATQPPSSNLTLSASWAQKPVALAATWADIQWALHHMFPHAARFVLPHLKLYATDSVSAAVPATYRAFFPTHLPAVEFAFHVDHAEVHGGQPVVESFSALGERAQFNLVDAEAHVAFHYHGQLRLAQLFNAMPQGPSASVSTSASGLPVPRNVSSVLVEPLNNTFIFSLKLDRRSNITRASVPVDECLNLPIVLKPGLNLVDALKEALRAQLPAVCMAPMLFTINPQRHAGRLILRYEELVLNTTTTLYQGDLLVPLALSIGNSSVAALGNASDHHATTFMLVGDAQLQFGASAEASIGEASGHLGIVKASSVFVGARASGSFSLALASPNVTVHEFFSSASDIRKFFPTFEVDLDLDANFTLSHIEVDVSLPLLPPADLYEFGGSFVMEGHWPNIANEGEFNATAQGLHFYPHFHGHSDVVDTIEQLMAVNGSAMCDATNLAIDAIERIAQSKGGGTSLPFVHHQSVASIFEQRVASFLRHLAVSICQQGNSTEPLTMEMFCAAAEAIFNSSVCHSRTVEGTQLAIDIRVLDRHYDYSDSFAFDTSTLLGSTATKIPIGVGTNTGIVLQTEVSAYLELVIDFAHDGFAISLGPGTNLSASLDFSLDGTVQAWFGPLSVELGGLNAYLGTPTVPMMAIVHFESDGRPSDMSVSGSAFLGATINLLDTRCVFDLTIQHVDQFLRGCVPAIDYVDCRYKNSAQPLEDLLEAALEQSSLFEYAQDAFRVIQQFEGAVLALDGNFFGTDGALENLVVPLIETAAQYLLIERLHDMITPSRMMEFQRRLANMTLTIERNNTIHQNAELIELEAVFLFTQVLNDILPYKVEPLQVPTTGVDVKEYVWPAHLGKADGRTLASLGFALGSHGLASLTLDSRCKETLSVDWELNFEIVWSKKDGLLFRFPLDSTVVSANVALDIHDVPSQRRSYDDEQPCTLSGHVGPLGAEVIATGHVKGGFSVVVVVASPPFLPSPPPSSRVYTSLLDIMDPPTPPASKMHGSAAIDVSLQGSLELGPVGIFGVNDLLAMPHYYVGLSLGAKFDLATFDFTPDINMTDVSLCTGTIVLRMIRQVLKAVKPILDPLAEFIGPDGLLLRNVPIAEYIFFQRMNLLQVIEHIIKHYCPKCTFEGVNEAIQFMSDIIQVEKMLEHIAYPSKPVAGCAGRVPANANFSIDFRQIDPAPDFIGTQLPFNWNTPPDFKSGPQLPTDQQHAINETWKYVGASTRGTWGLSFPIFHDIPRTLVNFFLRRDEAVIALNVPRLVLSAGIAFPIEVWGFPQVDILIAFGASATINLRQVILPASALFNTFHSHDLGDLISGLALPTIDPVTHAKVWVLSGSVTLGGGVSVGVYIFDGFSSVSLTATLSLGWPDLNQNGLIYFSQIWWSLVKSGQFFETLDKRLILTCMFELGIEACIPLPWHKYCWKIVDIKIHATVYHQTWPATVVDAPANRQGCFELGKLRHLSASPATLYSASSSGYVLRAQQTPQGLVLSAYGNKGPTDPASSTRIPADALPASISASGPEPGPLVFQSINATVPIKVPASDLVTFQLWLSSYQATLGAGGTVAVTPTRVIYGSARATLSRCALIDLINPTLDSTFALNGSACAVHLQTQQTSNVTVAGSAALYGGRSVTIGGVPQAVYASLSDVYFHVDTAVVSVSATPSPLLLNFDAALSTLMLQGDLHLPTTFDVVAVPATRRVSVSGGDGNDIFNVVMQGVAGLLGLYGAGKENLVDMTYETGVGGTNIRLTRYMATQASNEPDGFHTSISWDRILRRIATVNGRAGEPTETTVYAVEPSAAVLVNTNGEAQATMTTNLYGCDETATVDVVTRGAGTHQVNVGKNGQLMGTKCTVFVHALESETTIVHIDDSNAVDPMEYRLAFGVVSAVGPTGLEVFRVQHDPGVTLRHLRVGSRSSVVTIDDVGGLTETLVEYVTNDASDEVRQSEAVHLVNVSRTTSAVAFVGAFTDLDAGNGMLEGNPLETLRAPIVLAGAAGRSGDVHVVSRRGAPAVRHRLDSVCLSTVSQTTGEPVPTRPPSTTFMAALRAAGYTDTPTANCSIAFSSLSGQRLFVNMTDATGDSFVAHDAPVPLVVRQFDGDDTATIAACERHTVELDAGLGADTMTVSEPAHGGSIYDFGADNMTDLFSFCFVTVHAPSQNDSCIGPLYESAEPNAYVWTLNNRAPDIAQVIKCTGELDTQVMQFKVDSVVVPVPSTYDSQRNVVFRRDAADTPPPRFNCSGNRVLDLTATGPEQTMVITGDDLVQDYATCILWLHGVRGWNTSVVIDVSRVSSAPDLRWRISPGTVEVYSPSRGGSPIARVHMDSTTIRWQNVTFSTGAANDIVYNGAQSVETVLWTSSEATAGQAQKQVVRVESTYETVLVAPATRAPADVALGPARTLFGSPAPLQSIIGQVACGRACATVTVQANGVGLNATALPVWYHLEGVCLQQLSLVNGTLLGARQNTTARMLAAMLQNGVGVDDLRGADRCSLVVSRQVPPRMLTLSTSDASGDRVSVEAMAMNLTVYTLAGDDAVTVVNPAANTSFAVHLGTGSDTAHLCGLLHYENTCHYGWDTDTDLVTIGYATTHHPNEDDNRIYPMGPDARDALVCLQVRSNDETAVVKDAIGVCSL